MPLIVDGHNLIPRIPGLSLSQIDDEMQLVDLLQEYCRLARKQVEVYFDLAPPGLPRARRFGNVTARFVRAGQTADQAIRARLARLGREARNWTVVSSDGEVQAAARAARAGVISSDDFARQLAAALGRTPSPEERSPEPLSKEEIDDWLRLFGGEEGTEQGER